MREKQTYVGIFSGAHDGMNDARVQASLLKDGRHRLNVVRPLVNKQHKRLAADKA